MRRTVILIVALALLGTGCGDDDDSGGSTAGTTPTTAGSPVSLPAGTPFHGTADAEDGMELELDDFYFGPTVVEATPGQTFKVELFNEGAAPHTFTVDSMGIDEQLAPEQRMEITVTAPSAAGTVEFYCRFHRSSAQMQGALVVA
jgi:plastocyanin